MCNKAGKAYNVQEMKRKIRHIIFGLILILSPIFINSVYADEPPPPPPHGTGGDWQPGGSAPIGNGTLLLVLMGTAYGIRRLYTNRRKLIE